MSNLQKRLITGTALTFGMAAILFGDSWIYSKPFLPFCMILLCLATCLEVMSMFALPKRGVYSLLPFTLV